MEWISSPKTGERLTVIFLVDHRLQPWDATSRLSERPNLFNIYNGTAATETPMAWGKDGKPSLKSKPLFQEDHCGIANMRAGKPNKLVLEMPDGLRHEKIDPIVTIGSLPANDIVISDRNVSRRHCVILNYPGDVWLYDLDSAGGTMVDGNRLFGRMFFDEVRGGRRRSAYPRYRHGQKESRPTANPSATPRLDAVEGGYRKPR